jgi:ATP/ADP translocase
MSPEFLWKLAEVIDFIHRHIVTPLMLVLPIYYAWSAIRHKKHQKRFYYAGIFGFTVFGLQAAYLDCPMLVFSHWLRSFKNPQYDSYRNSWVRHAYEGPLAVLHWPIAIFAFAMAAYYIVRLRRHNAAQDAAAS